MREKLSSLINDGYPFSGIGQTIIDSCLLDVWECVGSLGGLLALLHEIMDIVWTVLK